MSVLKTVFRDPGRMAAFAALVAASWLPALDRAVAGDAQVADPAGVLRKPIPDKLVVLTFDDGPLSGYTVVAPILTSFGFGGSFYVCDFDSFGTRKDWYMTWRQMKALAAAGFEVGNHSKGHGSSLEAMLLMDDQLQANGVPKPTTIAWPLHMANFPATADLVADGYVLARGGHNRPYRPTVDHPFEIPSMWCGDMDGFVRMVRQAAGGRIVVICYHGVPDMEHPAVSLDPEVFRQQMQYLKDNGYKAIALRDLVEYIDPAKALKLPRTVGERKDAGAPVLASEEKPFVDPGHRLEHFGFRDAPGSVLPDHTIRLAVPHARDVTRVTPEVRLPAGATLEPAADVARDFTHPQAYTMTCADGWKTTYTVNVIRRPASTARDMMTCEVPGQAVVARNDGKIVLFVAAATDVTRLAPVYTLVASCTAVPPSGTIRDFSTPQTYTVTAEDGSTRAYEVIAVKTGRPNAFRWTAAGDGTWGEASNWTNLLGEGGSPTSRDDCLLDLGQAGNHVVGNDLADGFQLHHLVLGAGSAGMTLAGRSLAFVRCGATNEAPAIHAFKCRRLTIDNDLELRADLSVNTAPDKDPNAYLVVNGTMSGDGALILNSHGDPDVAGSNFHDVHHGILHLTKANTYRGGTIVNGGKIIVEKTGGLGSGPVRLERFGRLEGRAHCTNELVVRRGTLLHCTWDGPARLEGDLDCIGTCEIAGTLTGTGGVAMLGTNGTYLNMVPGGTLTFGGSNAYTGPTVVFPGTLVVKKAAGLYGADPAKWTAANLTIHQAATLRLNVGGPEEFTGSQVSALLAGLTGKVDHNGLLAGATLCVDTTNATGDVIMDGVIADSQGPGGGAFVFRRRGGGVLRLAGNNTYTGQTILEGGTVVIASLNSVDGGAPCSSLGAPSSLENGIIEVAGDCTITYTGKGERTDRIVNLTGASQTVALDQSGTGLLTFMSPLDISGCGHPKTLVLTGVGSGELAGALADPFDRKKTARTSVRKAGSGVWTLSAANTFTGTTSVEQGILSLTNPRGLTASAEVSVADGAALDLGFSGSMTIATLSLGGMPQAPGTYDARTSPGFLRGAGSITVRGGK